MPLGKTIWRRAPIDRLRGPIRKAAKDTERILMRLMTGPLSSATGLLRVDLDEVAFDCRCTEAEACAAFAEAEALGLAVWDAAAGWLYLLGSIAADPPASSNNWKGYHSEIDAAPESVARDAATAELGEWGHGWERGVFIASAKGLRTPFQGASEGHRTQIQSQKQKQGQIPEADAEAPDKPAQAVLCLASPEAPAKADYTTILGLWAELLPTLGQPRKHDAESKLGIALRKAWKADPDEAIWRQRFERFGKHRWNLTEWRPDMLRLLALTEELDGGRYDQKGPAPEPHMYDTAKVFR